MTIRDLLEVVADYCFVKIYSDNRFLGDLRCAAWKENPSLLSGSESCEVFRIYSECGSVFPIIVVLLVLTSSGDTAEDK